MEPKSMVPFTAILPSPHMKRYGRVDFQGSKHDRKP